MKKTVLTVGFLILSGCSVGVTSEKAVLEGALLRSEQNIHRVSVEKFKELLESGEGTVLDVRTLEELAAGRIVDEPLHIDFYEENYETEIAKLDRSATYLLHCKVGGRSGDTLPLMKSLGFQNVYELESGIDGWERSGHEMVR